MASWQIILAGLCPSMGSICKSATEISNRAYTCIPLHPASFSSVMQSVELWQSRADAHKIVSHLFHNAKGVVNDLFHYCTCSEYNLSLKSYLLRSLYRSLMQSPLPRTYTSSNMASPPYLVRLILQEEVQPY